VVEDKSSLVHIGITRYGVLGHNYAPIDFQQHVFSSLRESTGRTNFMAAYWSTCMCMFLPFVHPVSK